MHNFIYVYLHARSSIHISQHGSAEPLPIFVGVFTFKTSSWGTVTTEIVRRSSVLLWGTKELSEADMGAVIVDAKRLFPDIVEEKLINQHLT